MTILVKDIMSKPVLKIDYNASVERAGKEMAKNRKYAILVVKKGNPVGILTDSDLIKKVVAKNKKPSSIKVKDLMSAPLVSVTPETSVLDASRKMKRNNLKRLPIISENKLVGIISTTDIARTVPEMIDILEFKLKPKEFPPKILEEETSGICDSCDNYSENLKLIDNQWLCDDCQEDVEI